MKKGKVWLTILSTIALLAFVATVFWYQDLQYSLPTHRPTGLIQPSVGEALRLSPQLAHLAAGTTRPLALHFFNPACPCSRFNIDHVRGLMQWYGSRVQFVAVLQGTSKDDPEHLLETFRGLNLQMLAVLDLDGGIARACGVYSTPQAVVLDGSRLFFRGNYNVSRYCLNSETEFARIALDALLAGKASPEFGELSSVAYGCELPKRSALSGPSAAGAGRTGTGSRQRPMYQ